MYKFFVSCRKDISVKLLRNEITSLTSSTISISPKIAHFGVNVHGNLRTLQKCIDHLRLAESIWLQIQHMQLNTMSKDALHTALSTVKWSMYYDPLLMRQLPLRVFCTDCSMTVRDVKGCYQSVMAESTKLEDLRHHCRKDSEVMSTDGGCVCLMVNGNTLTVQLKASGRFSPRPYLYDNEEFATPPQEKQSILKSTPLLVDVVREIQMKFGGRPTVSESTGSGDNGDRVALQKSLLRNYSPNYVQQYFDYCALNEEAQLLLGGTDSAHPPHEKTLSKSITRDLEMHRINFIVHETQKKASPVTAAMAAQFLYTCNLSDLLRRSEDLVLWDPFCNTGDVVLEMLSSILQLPIYTKDTPLPYKKMNIFKQEESNSCESALLLPNISIVASDTDEEALYEAFTKLERFYEYYKSPYFEGVSPPKKIEEEETIIVGVGGDKNEVMGISQGPHIISDTMHTNGYGWSSQDIIKRRESTQNYSSSIDNKPPLVEINGMASFEMKSTRFWKLREYFNVYLLSGECTEIAPFISNSILLTYIPAKSTRVHMKLDEMIRSNMFEDVHVMTEGNAFVKSSNYVWRDVTAKGVRIAKPHQQLKVFRWSGAMKSHATH